MRDQSFHIFKSFSQAVDSHQQRLSIRQKKGDTYIDYTFTQVRQESLRYAGLLKKYGIGKGDKVAVCIGNLSQYAFILLGVMSLDAVLVPLDNQFLPLQVKDLLEHSESKVFFVTQKVYNRLEGFLDGKKVFVLDSPEFREEFKQQEICEDGDFSSEDPDQLAVLFYTSGTTGKPKGVMLSHENLLSNVRGIRKLKLVGPGDVMISILPLHHAYSFTVTLLTPLLCGATIVYPEGISSMELTACLNETGSTILVGVPQIFSLICRSVNEKMRRLTPLKKAAVGLLGKVLCALRRTCKINLCKKLFAQVHEAFGKDLRFMVSGGARLDVHVARQFYSWGFTIIEGYGLTETSPVVTINPLKKNKIGSVGTPLQDVEVRIVKEDKNEKEGEVAIQGPNVMKGYYKNQEETDKVLKHGWFYTGDVGYLDKDGYLYLTGRRKEIIVSSAGKNIYPDEIERHYSQSAVIKEICVVEAATASALSETTDLCAVIVIDEEYFRNHVGTGVYDKVKWEIDTLSLKLPSYKRLKGFVISKGELPHTRLGKLMRYKVKEIYKKLIEEKQQFPAVPETDEEILSEGFDEVSRRAYDYLQKTLERKVKPDDHLEIDLGLDSLGRIEVLLGIQDSLNLEMPEEKAEEFFACDTVGDLLEKLREIIPEKHTIDSNGKEEGISWDSVLKQDPPQEILEKINMKPGIFYITLNLFFVLFIKILLRVFYLLRTQGKENLPRSGAYVICPNHNSYLDGFFILTALPFKVVLNTFFVGYSAIFESFFLKKIARLARLISIDARTNLVDSLKTCAFVLKNSKVLCYFPEGQRSIDGEVKKFKKGIGILVKETGVPVVPVYIEGSFYTWPRAYKFPRLHPVKVKFSPACQPKDLLPSEEKTDPYEDIAETLREKVKALQ